MHGDHLGSTSVATCGNSACGAVTDLVARQYYYPYGSERDIGLGGLPTDHTYTGQIADGTGLMYYGARYYDPYINRWVQPDSIVPEPGEPQSLNRYAYVRGNPIKYTDPTGHREACEEGCYHNYAPHVPYLVILSIVLQSETAGAALVEAFNTSRLEGYSAAARFEDVLDGTRNGGVYFRVEWGNSGLRHGLNDAQYYDLFWGGESNQIAHFLTAAALAYGADTLFAQSAIVGHEMAGDIDSWSGARSLGNNAWQILLGASSEDARGMFMDAVAADLGGDARARDEYLNAILALNGLPLQQRQGNSLQDLRNSVRGWEFGAMIRSGAFETRHDAAAWLALNVAVP